jgi:hypothetical protein
MNEAVRILENCKRIIELMPKKTPGSKYCLDQIDKFLNQYYADNKC